MTEREKARFGYLYNPTEDAELAGERLRCKDLCHEHNAMKPSDVAGRQAVLRKIIGKLGRNFYFEQPFMCDYGYNIEIGDNFYANHNFIVLDCARVKIGNNVFIAPNCGLYTAGHALDTEQRNAYLEVALPITIGNNVWIGGGVTVVPGVTIGDDTVIGAGSVVTKDIPAGVIAAGNPCRPLRKITEADRDKYKRV